MSGLTFSVWFSNENGVVLGFVVLGFIKVGFMVVRVVVVGFIVVRVVVVGCVVVLIVWMWHLFLVLYSVCACQLLDFFGMCKDAILITAMTIVRQSSLWE